jgi:hypothetical protein
MLDFSRSISSEEPNNCSITVCRRPQPRPLHAPYKPQTAAMPSIADTPWETRRRRRTTPLTSTPASRRRSSPFPIRRFTASLSGLSSTGGQPLALKLLQLRCLPGAEFDGVIRQTICRIARRNGRDARKPVAQPGWARGDGDIGGFVCRHHAPRRSGRVDQSVPGAGRPADAWKAGSGHRLLMIR